MIIGWIAYTAIGVRVWVSQDRKFEPVVNGRREQILRSNELQRSMATIRRKNWRLARQHLDGHHVAVRVWGSNPDRAA